MYPLKEPMHIHSLGGELAEATILERMGDNRYLAEYNGVKCSAIYNRAPAESYGYARSVTASPQEGRDVI